MTTDLAVKAERALCEGCGRITSIPLQISKRAGTIRVSECDVCAPDLEPRPGSEEAWRRTINAKREIALKTRQDRISAGAKQPDSETPDAIATAERLPATKNIPAFVWAPGAALANMAAERTAV